MFWTRVVLALFCILDGILACHLAWGGNGAMEYMHLRRTYSRMATEIDRLDVHNVALSKEIRRLKDNPSYVERVARGELNFVGKKEILYLFEPSKGTRQGHDSNS